MTPLARLCALATTVVLTLSLTLTGAGPAVAQPDENGTPTLMSLRANLGAAAEGFIKAESELAASQAKQAAHQQLLATAEADITEARKRLAVYAAESYRSGRITPISMLLSATSTDDFLGRAKALDKISRGEIGKIDALNEAKARSAEAQAAIDAEVAAQAAALAEMAKRKEAAEKALAAASARRSEVDMSGVPIALPAPRNPDGSWPGESCNMDDPTTGGCITPRTMHSIDEAKRAGFNWYVACFRTGDQYEHPKGRACDYAAYPSGFVNSSAGGANKNYGDRLAAFFVKNAKALGVMYVVWYCQIWQYSSGWHVYKSAGANCGDQPAGDHTNHVHVSLY
jgi:hypothetical protein